MVDLLSAAERIEIREALKSVMLTYSTSAITLITTGVSLDRFNEDRNDIETFSYSLNAYVEYSNGNKVLNGGNMGGGFDRADVKVIIDMDLLEPLGLLTDNRPNINATTSSLIIRGEEFEVVAVSGEGSLEDRNLACYIWGSRQVRKAI